MSGNADETLTIGYYSLPPHSMNLQGKPDGAAIHYLQQEVFSSDNYHIHWQYHPFARVLAELQSGRLDAALLIANTPQRENRFRYPKSYLYQTRSGLITLKQYPLKTVDKLSQLNGMILGHVIGSVRPKAFSQLDIKFDDISGKDFTTRNIQKLTNKRIDGVYVPTLSHAQYQLRDGQHEQLLNFIPLPEPGHKLYLVFRKDIAEQVISDFEMHNADHAIRYEHHLRPFRNSMIED